MTGRRLKSYNEWEPETDDYGWDPSVFAAGFDPGAAPNPFEPRPVILRGQEYDPEDPTRGIHPVGAGNKQQTREDALTVRGLSQNDQTWSGHRDPLEDLVPDQEAGEVAPDEEREVVKSEETSAETSAVTTEPAGKPTYHDVDERVSERGPHTGARPNPFGREDEPQATREELMARASEAYDQANADLDAHAWEDEFVRNHQRTSDEDVNRAYNLQSFMWGSDHGMRFRQMRRGEQADYEAGIMQARQADMANRRVSKGLAQSIAAARLVSPEEAANLRMSDPVVKAFTSGAYGQGSRYENLEQKYTLHQNDQNRRMAELEAKLAAQAELSREKNASNERVASTFTRGKKASTELAPEDQRATIARNLFEMFEGKGIALTGEQVRAAAAGDYSLLPPEHRDRAQLIVESLRGFNDKPSLRPVAPGVSAEQGKVPTRVGQATDIEHAKLPTRSDSIARRDQLIDIAGALKAADVAWRRMRQDPEAAAAWVQYGPEGPEALKSAAGLRNWQAEATDLYNLRNILILANAGKAVTDRELQSQLEQAGMAGGIMDPFKDATGYQRFLDRLKTVVKRRRDSMAAEGSWPRATQQ